MPSTSGQDPQFIKNLFGSIAGTYDRANDAITFGMVHLWRAELVRRSEAREGSQILDCATGTGDLAFAFAKKTGDVTGIDFCPEMIELAQKKNAERGQQIKFSVADALNLPFSNASFDVTSIGYGIRNVADVARAVREMARVTRPGGSVMILETGEVSNRTLRAAVVFYFKNFVPMLGGLVSGRRDAYEYLQKSSGVFPSGEKFCSMLRELGVFAEGGVTYESLMGGASFIYRAVVA